MLLQSMIFNEDITYSGDLKVHDTSLVLLVAIFPSFPQVVYETAYGIVLGIYNITTKATATLYLTCDM